MWFNQVRVIDLIVRGGSNLTEPLRTRGNVEGSQSSCRFRTREFGGSATSNCGSNHSEPEMWMVHWVRTLPMISLLFNPLHLCSLWISRFLNPSILGYPSGSEWIGEVRWYIGPPNSSEEEDVTLHDPTIHTFRALVLSGSNGGSAGWNHLELIES